MATPTDKDAIVADLILLKLQDVATALGLPIAMPDVAFDPSTDGADGYLAVNHQPNVPKFEGLSGGGKVMDQGLLSVAIMHPKGRGIIGPLNVVGAIKAALPSGTRMHRDGVRVTITRDPWTASPLLGHPFTLYPVTIAWEAA